MAQNHYFEPLYIFSDNFIHPDYFRQFEEHVE